MDKPDDPLDRSWGVATWDGARRNALRPGERLSLAEKIAWLEETETLAAHLAARRAARRTRPAQVPESDTEHSNRRRD